jgi:hypothetical protein
MGHQLNYLPSLILWEKQRRSSGKYLGALVVSEKQIRTKLLVQNSAGDCVFGSEQQQNFPAFSDQRVSYKPKIYYQHKGNPQRCTT